MPWPENLTADQQTALISFTTSLRSWAASLAQLNILGTLIAAEWSGGVSALNGALQSGDIIPNGSALAGSQDLAPADVANLANWATALANTSNSDQGTGSFASSLIQAVCVKAAGINASL